MTLEIIKTKYAEIESFCKKEGIVYMGVFGSVARKQETQNSDIDLYVKYLNRGDKSLLDILKMENNLSNLFGKKVELIHNPTPFVLNTRGLPWICIFEKLIDDPVLWQEVREGKDKKAKEEAVVQARVVYQSLTNNHLPPQEIRMMVEDMLGERPGSCPVLFKGTAFQVFSSNSLELGTSSLSGSDQYGSLEFECPKCKKSNKRSSGKLIPNCHYCNADVSC